MTPTAVESNIFTTSMFSESQLKEPPVTFTGPLVYNAPTVISLLSPSQLRQYPYLPQLKILINAAFASTHSKNDIFPVGVERLRTDTQLIDEIGPDFFTLIISSVSSASTNQPTLFATASARRLLPKDYTKLPEILKTLKRSQSPLEDFESWELKLLAVDPSIHRQGLASMLMKLLEAEIKKRWAESRLSVSFMQFRNATKDADGGGSVNVSKPKGLRFLLDTVKEINEGFYLRRGFVATEELEFAPGTFGGMGGFTEVFMEKVLTATEGSTNDAETE